MSHFCGTHSYNSNANVSAMNPPFHNAQNGAAEAVPNGHHAADAQQATAGTRGGEEKSGQDGDAKGAAGAGGLERCLTELSRTVPDFPGLELKAEALLVSRT